VCEVTHATGGVTNWRSVTGADGTMGGGFSVSVPVGPAFCFGDVSRLFPITTTNELQALSR
jgi:hypothetical protein